MSIMVRLALLTRAAAFTGAAAQNNGPGGTRPAPAFQQNITCHGGNTNDGLHSVDRPGHDQYCAIIFDHGLIAPPPAGARTDLPKPGWVEHNPKEIWDKRRIGQALSKANITRHNITVVTNP
jgi:glycerol kinase